MFPPVKGGSSRYAYEITNALGRKGHEVDIFTQRVDGESMELPLHKNVQVHRVCKARRYLVIFETIYYSLQARRKIGFSQYDVIHGTLMPASTVAVPSLSDPPIVLTSHSFAPREVTSHSAEHPADYLLKYIFHPMNAGFDAITGRRSDHVIAISSEMREQLIDTYRFDRDDVSLITHGVDTDTFYPREGTYPAVSEDKTTALFVGRLITRKGADRAIRSIARTGHDDVELLIAGTGRDEARLRNLASELNIKENVRFLGYVPDSALPKLYSSADLLLFTSDYEGFGLVILEAMACGTPVIGSPVGGVPDVVENGENGYVVSRSPDSFAERIDQLHDAPDELDQLANAARETATKMTWDKVAEQVISVYQSVITSEA